MLPEAVVKFPELKAALPEAVVISPDANAKLPEATDGPKATEPEANASLSEPIAILA